jgi:hypothetical protein
VSAHKKHNEVSPPKPKVNPEQLIPSAALMEEVRAIKRDADAIVAASLIRGFFSRQEQDITAEELS